MIKVAALWATVIPLMADSSHLRAQSTDKPDADRVTAIAIPTPAGTSRNNAAGDIIARVCSEQPGENIPRWNVAGWEPYQRLWNELAANPEDSTLRKYLGLPIGNAARQQSVLIKSSRGRSAPNWLGWKSGSYRQVETPHLQIFSHADDDATREVAADLERVYWVWTQIFFPLWESNAQVALQLGNVPEGEKIASALSKNPTRLTSRRKLRIVLLKDSADYARTLGQSMPGIEQSTGFYSDERQTSFFYPSTSADAVATRRHELIHQLFREATRSGLSGDSPGSKLDFWLVEGIAGYFESLQFVQNTATVGGWDSPRLQFARYRVLGGRDFIPLQELRFGGRDHVQKQADLARWYANAIAYTHVLMDGDSISDRRWIYRLLASLYQIRIEIPGADTPSAAERKLVEFLKIDDNIIQSNPTKRELTELCLSGCEVTGQTLAKLQTDEKCRWIDLSRMPITVRDIIKLCPAPSGLDQLSLEVTDIDDSISIWLQLAKNLRELDLSWTACGDETLASISDHSKLRTLWMTGSKITDASIANLINMRSLESLDVQRTQITPAGLAELKTRRPDCKINPLQLREQ